MEQITRKQINDVMLEHDIGLNQAKNIVRFNRLNKAIDKIDEGNPDISELKEILKETIRFCAP